MVGVATDGRREKPEKPKKETDKQIHFMHNLNWDNHQD